MENLPLTKCNRCGKTMVEPNPNDDVPSFPVPPKMKELSLIYQDGEYFYACPNCKTDEFLQEIHHISEIPVFTLDSE